MKLKPLIKQANTTYRLGLDEGSANDLYHRLISAGYKNEVQANQTSSVLDTILVMSDQLKKQSPTARSVKGVYASLKRETIASSGDGNCPRCEAQLQEVKLVGDRTALYCGACAITLPVRVE